ncbi:MAG: MoaD/ThiS family protein [Acidobacteriota bacterium]|nr:MoaD/ThiS family protein [Acidobacteriota bacterium]
MRVTVKLFARLREVTGRDTIARDVASAGPATVGDVWRSLVEEWPGLAAFDSSVSGAVNAEYARMTREISEGDEVAFLPPVSGG